ncbi:MAG TPA: type II toxin-antitoxin system RelE/ParE family toxin [Candidatus Acidoferrales bacterium]
MQQSLLRNPQRGDLVQGLGGIRKSRVGNPTRGKGSRGGYRCLYLFLERREHIHLLFILDKNEQEDLDASERALLKRMVVAAKTL